MKDSDRLQRFLFEGSPIRGKLIRLGAAWQAVIERGDYPGPVRSRLGNALVAAPMMAATLEFEGDLILQIQGEGPMHLLVAQTDDSMHVRGLARWRDVVPDAALQEQCRDGRLAITVLPERGPRYQGTVPLEQDDLASCLESYFEISEQLPTRIMLASDDGYAAGLLVQRTPGEMPDSDAWERVRRLTETLSDEELLRLPFEQILRRLFHEEDVRVFEPNPVAFRCGCTRVKTVEVLRRLGRAEVDAILREEGEVSVRCEFCNRDYRFDAVDVAELFESESVAGPDTLQ